MARCYSSPRHSCASDYYLPSHRASTSPCLRNSDFYPSASTSGHHLSLQPDTPFEEDLHKKAGRQGSPTYCEKGQSAKVEAPGHNCHSCHNCHRRRRSDDPNEIEVCPKRQQNARSKDYYGKAHKTLRSLFQKYWFLLGLGLVIGLAWAFPQVGKSNGIIQAQYTVKWCAVIVIFLLSGLGIDVRVMPKVIMQWRLHLVVQGINFLVLPFIMYGVVLFFITVDAQLDSVVYKGWIIAMSTSTTVSSNVVMTRNAKGSDSSALVNAALGNVMGILICPALMSIYQQDPRIFPPNTPRGNPNYINVLRTLGFTVLLPLIIGQAVRYFFNDPVKKLAARARFPIINNLALLTLVWSVFCDGVASNAFHQMSSIDMVAIIFVNIVMYMFGCALCLFVARPPWPTRLMAEPAWFSKWRFSHEDSVAIMYCGATKTVSMGIPLINVLYAESSYGVVGVLSLPLLMYHIIQLFIGNVQVQYLKAWVVKNATTPSTLPTTTNMMIHPTTDTRAIECDSRHMSASACCDERAALDELRADDVRGNTELPEDSQHSSITVKQSMVSNHGLENRA
ncbi:SBF-like CPA transporter family-domain-containing protein [Syncephalastrum racemosum]|uniref:SBF-like CPA transporter family-domain-containing protein n=1 Tax=Syncephalastrum racemosum TaxID=13706 RepID=A0A1X2HI04_SYNRA|nr:SBF-like CPA transporter family-domain-containing protein [Syncephalastrum racemosum]